MTGRDPLDLMVTPTVFTSNVGRFSSSIRDGNLYLPSVLSPFFSSLGLSAKEDHYRKKRTSALDVRYTQGWWRHLFPVRRVVPSDPTRLGSPYVLVSTVK